MHNGLALFSRAMACERIAIRMTERGVLVDPGKFKRHYKKFRTKRARARRILRSVAAKYDKPLINPNAHQQVHELFFKDLGCAVTKRSMKTGKPSIDEDVIRRLCVHQNDEVKLAARALGAHRRWHALVKFVKNIPEDNTYHVSWNVNHARTGRWSANPNLMNIPQAHERRLGDRIIRTPSLRDGFIARPGHLLVKADYSQLELRVVALLAGDKPLLEAYESGEDVHAINARMLFPKFDTFSEAKQKQTRTLAKVFAYAANYGAEPVDLWKRLSVDFPNLSLALVEYMYDRWFDQHIAIYRWQQDAKKLARKLWYVECPLSGRRQYYVDGEIDENEVLNYPVQGTGADIIDEAIQRVDRECDWEKTFILMQVHDELVGEAKGTSVKTKPVRHMVETFKHEMATVIELNDHKMRIPVDVSVGPDWDNCEEIAV